MPFRNLTAPARVPDFARRLLCLSALLLASIPLLAGAGRCQSRQAVRLAHLAAQHQALTSGNVVTAAYAFRGTRYVMGGTSRSGFDCSGFVRYILGNAGGVSLPRTAVEQFWHGAPVAAADMRPGDLVFFRNTYKRGISHVGIYAGGGRFIHAANPRRGVQMDSLDSAYYRGHFAGARRVLPAQMRSMAAQPQAVPPMH